MQAGKGPGYRTKALLFATILGGSNHAPAQILVDPLTSAVPGKGVARKIVTGGEFTAMGWRAAREGDMLIVELSQARELEGVLEIDLHGLDWRAMNAAPSVRGKIHFLNMFSNANGDHHCEDGGTSRDALWTLRGGRTDDGKAPRYGDGFKALWASQGAKRCTGSDYHELDVHPPPGWSWDSAKKHSFRIMWSKSKGLWTVHVNRVKFFENAWKNQATPLKYIFIAKAADYSTLVGPTFGNLRVFSSDTVPTHIRSPGRLAPSWNGDWRSGYLVLRTEGIPRTARVCRFPWPGGEATETGIRLRGVDGRELRLPPPLAAP
jgi:hypothetical protein